MFTLVQLIAALLLSFQSVDGLYAPAFVNMGSSGAYAVLAASTITNSGNTVLNGNLGLTPGSEVTGMGTAVLNGISYINDAGGMAAQAHTDLAAAIADCNSRVPNVTLPGDVGGLSLVPGIYKSLTTLTITGTLYLDAQNNPNAAWIFNVGTVFTVETNSAIIITNQAPSSNGHTNVWFNAGTGGVVKSGSQVVGVIMAQAAVTGGTGSTMGPMLSQGAAVTLLANTVGSYNAVSTTTPLPIVKFSSTVSIANANVTVTDGNVVLTANDTLTIQSAVAMSMGIAVSSCVVTSTTLVSRRRMNTVQDLITKLTSKPVDAQQAPYVFNAETFFASSSARQAASMHHTTLSTTPSIQAFDVAVETTADMANYPSYGTNSSLLYTDLTESLAAAASNGELESLMQSQGAYYHSGLQSATVGSAVNVTEPAVTYPDSSDNDENDLTKGELAAVVICSFVGFVAVIALLYCMCCAGKKEEQSYTGAAPTSAAADNKV